MSGERRGAARGGFVEGRGKGTGHVCGRNVTLRRNVAFLEAWKGF